MMKTEQTHISYESKKYDGNKSPYQTVIRPDFITKALVYSEKFSQEINRFKLEQHFGRFIKRIQHRSLKTLCSFMLLPKSLWIQLTQYLFPYFKNLDKVVKLIIIFLINEILAIPVYLGESSQELFVFIWYSAITFCT